ncbi:MAG: hypothetical protein BECKG1743D_GA0114223_107312 [Candidatus Kentron sp. G]|nr:MAG: hypothetical protein BECKG1743D_GA0114223_107312 [Candidatus Kentron sp. G]
MLSGFFDIDSDPDSDPERTTITGCGSPR